MEGLEMTTGRKVICQYIALKITDAHAANQLRQRYTYTPRLPYGAPKHARPAPIRLFQEDARNGYLCIPRDPAVLRRLETMADVVDAQRPAAAATNLGFNGALDPARHQDRAVEAVVEKLTATRYGGGALLSLPTGYGKTACALYVTTRLARLSLILVHTKILADQWVERIAHFVPGARVLVVTPQTYGNGPEEWANVEYVVMLMQTLLCKASPAHRPYCEVVDMVMVDETHHLAARTLCRAMEIAGCRYRLGLSATIERKDGLHGMLEHLLGPVAFEVGRETNPNVVVHTYVYAGQNTDTDADLSYAEALTRTAGDSARTAFVAQIIRKWYAQKKYMVVMSDRRSQLQEFEILLKDLPILWAVGGGASPDLTEVKKTRPVILATYGYCAEGMDIPDLDTCVLATSRCELRQCIGRILRKHGPGHHPIVCDVVDAGYRVLRRQAGTRRKWFAAPLTKNGLAAFIVDEAGDGGP